MAKAQEALRKMPWRQFDPMIMSRLSRMSCTSNALSHFLGHGVPGGWKLVQVTDRAWNLQKEALRNPAAYTAFGPREWFGLSAKNCRKLYHEFGMKCTMALENGQRFPWNCVLWLKNVETGKGHVVARVDGVLLDMFDCREAPYEILAYFTPIDKTYT